MSEIAAGIAAKATAAAKAEETPVLAMLQQQSTILERVVKATETSVKHAETTACFQLALLDHFKRMENK